MPAIKTVEVGGRRFDASENVTLTQPLSDEEIAETVGEVVARADEDLVEDMVIALEVRARETTSDEIALSEFLELVDRNPDGSRRA